MNRNQIHKRSTVVLLVLFIQLLTCFLHGQLVSYHAQKGDVFAVLKQSGGAEVNLYQDKQIEELFLKNVSQKSKSAQIPGFRIRIFSNLGQSAREGSIEAENRFQERFPNVPSYRIYEAPYFKVYVGDFRTKLEAHRFVKEVRRVFPDAFDIPSDINFPVIDIN